MQNTGRLLILSGSAGAGKDTICDLIVAQSSFVRFPTYTTRAPRPGEIAGIHYHFITLDTFELLATSGRLFDPVGIHDFYAVPLPDLLTALDDGRDLLIRLAEASAARLKSVIPRAITVLVLPPSEAAAEIRLINRGMTSNEITRRRDNEPKSSETVTPDLVVVNKDGEIRSTVTEILAYMEQV